MCILLGCKEATLPVKYLGISLEANPKLVKTWKPIIYKVEEKLNLWKAKMINKTGKLVLIKSVLNSLPVYYLNLYKMSRAVADKLISLPRRFLWSNEDGRDGVPLVRWDIVQAPKRFGGLGVGNAVLRNAALLFKWWWRFSKKDCPLWKKIVCFCNDLKPNVLLSCQSIPNIKGCISKTFLGFKSSRICYRGLWVLGWAGVDMKLSLEKGTIPMGVELVNQLHEVLQSALQTETLPEDIMSYSFTRSIWRELVWCTWIYAYDKCWSILGTIKQHFESLTGALVRKVEHNKWLIDFFAIMKYVVGKECQDFQESRNMRCESYYQVD
ncbi:uncharacterized protein [Arachis hypogaea]|uniref:uncharacterized protein n=1 Tax=Arachis hypogaea TaxID=3818 RepID=UPI000DECD941|nr:uncharacterized protein LOC112803200 [Arachis hypogaea]